MPSASRTTRCSRPAAIDLILTGHDHDLFINYDERNAMVESSYDAHYVTAIDVTISVQGAGRQARDDLAAAVPRDRHRRRDAGPRGCGGGREVRGRAHPRDGRAARHHRGRARQPQRHRAHARGRDRQPDRRRHARIDQGRRRDHERRRHPLRQGLSAGLDRSPGATCWRSCRSTIAWWCCEITGAELKAAIENGLSQLPKPAGVFRRCRA